LDPTYVLQLKLGVLGGSILSGIVGTIILIAAAKKAK
jgi:Na+/H+ antiporter NhaA